MAKNTNEVVNNTVVENTKKEENKMANNVQEAPVVEQQATTPVEAPVADQQAPAEVPAEETQKTFWDKHPKAKAAAETGKKWGKRLALLAAIGGGLFAFKKWGESVGFDKATDAYRNGGQSGNNPEPDENPDDDLGDAEFEELRDSEES